jgi:hypothetical protein
MAAEQAPDWLGGAAKLPAAGVDLAEKGWQDRAQFSG